MRRLLISLAAVVAIAAVAIVVWRWSTDSAAPPPGVAPERSGNEDRTPLDSEFVDWVGARGGGALTGAVPRLYPRYDRTWSGGLEARRLSGPVVIGPTVYVGTDRGEIVGWSIATGAEVARVPTGYGAIEAPLLTFDGDLLVGTLEGHFFRFDPVERRVVWERLGEAEIHGGANLVDAPVGPLVVWGDYQDNVIAVAAATGVERWRHVAGNYVNGTPSTDGQRVVVGSCDANLYILHAADGQLQHRFNTGAHVPNSPALLDGVAYSASHNGVVVAVTLLDGQEQWRVKAGNAGLFASPSVAGDKVLVAFENGTLVALDRTTGESHWSQSTAGSFRAGVVTDGSLLLVAGMDGRVRIHRVDSGAPEWSEQVGGAISVSPAVVGRRLVLVTEDGELVVYSAPPEMP